MSTISGIYKIVHRQTGRIYIGHSVNIQRRWWNHTAKNNECIHLKNAIQKYGMQAFDFIILEQIVEDNPKRLKQKLINREQFWLDTLQPFEDRGFNICRKANAGPSIKGIPKTGKCAAGENNKENVCVVCYDTLGNIIAEYPSIKIASKKTKIHPAGISNCCTGRSRIAGGYFWARKGELPNIRSKKKKPNPKHSDATKEKQRQARLKNNHRKGKPGIGKKCVNAINIQQNITLRFDSMHEAAKYFTVTIQCISRGVRGKTRVKGFVLSFV